MRTCVFVLLLLRCALGQAAPADVEAVSRAAGAIPVAAFFALPEVTYPQLSPDGTKIAFLFPLDGRRAVGVFDRATGQARLVIRATNESVDSLVWKGNEHLIAFADFHGNLAPDIILTDLSGKHYVKLNERFGITAILDVRAFDPETVVAMKPTNGGTAVSVVNVFTGKGHEVFRNPEGNFHARFGGFVADGHGDVRLLRRFLGKQESLVYRSGEGKLLDLQTWPIQGYTEPVDALSMTADGKTAYGVTAAAHGRSELRTLNPATGTWSDPLFTTPSGSIERLYYSFDRSRLYGVAYETDKVEYYWLDHDRAVLQASLEDAFPGFKPAVVSTSADEQVLLVLVVSDREPGAYYILDRTKKNLALFKRRLPQLDSRLLRPMEPIAFKARDGLELHGYLTRPWQSAPGKPVPLVMLPHGGPFGIRDSWGFDDEVQFLASRGYAVLQINYRGSGGYGVDFLNQGKGQWGRAMQDDLSDGVQWAIAQGVADPKRVAIYGSSYGGYAALAGVTLTPELYCCAVNYAGPSDLAITFHPRGSDAYLRGDDFDFQTEWIGATREYRNATSPIRLIERIRVPTLHAYGENDPIVEFDHWLRLKSELTRLHKPFEFLIEKDQGHGFDRGRASLEFYSRLEAFLAAHLREHSS